MNKNKIILLIIGISTFFVLGLLLLVFVNNKKEGQVSSEGLKTEIEKIVKNNEEAFRDNSNSISTSAPRDVEGLYSSLETDLLKRSSFLGVEQIVSQRLKEVEEYIANKKYSEGLNLLEETIALMNKEAIDLQQKNSIDSNLIDEYLETTIKVDDTLQIMNHKITEDWAVVTVSSKNAGVASVILKKVNDKWSTFVGPGTSYLTDDEVLKGKGISEEVIRSASDLVTTNNYEIEIKL